MARAAYRYDPDYSVPPGWVLEEHLEAWEMSRAEFARRCGRSPKLISEIVAGKAPIEPKTALQFEKVLGMDASVWLGIETHYRLYMEREAQKASDAEREEWAKRFPLDELVKRGYVDKEHSLTESLSAILSFFGVASTDAWEEKWKNTAVAYRHSPSFESEEAALATWLRMGEIEAEGADCADYNAPTFRRALKRIRRLTENPLGETIPEVKRLCQESGVFLAIVKPLPKTALSGVSRWLTPRKAMIQLSARHMSDDHLWFSLFHEAAHILIHGKRDIFVHSGGKGEVSQADAEADVWARDFLIPKRDWVSFVDSATFTYGEVAKFAEEQGIAPSIVVGRLQYEGLVPWSSLNGLKARLRWGGEQPMSDGVRKARMAEEDGG